MQVLRGKYVQRADKVGCLVVNDYSLVNDTSALASVDLLSDLFHLDHADMTELVSRHGRLKETMHELLILTMCHTLHAPLRCHVITFLVLSYDLSRANELQMVDLIAFQITLSQSCTLLAFFSLW